MAALIDVLCAKLGTQIDIRGRAHADCPMCGASAQTRTGGRSYHFYLYDLANGKRGAVCWACGWRGSLTDLAAELNVSGRDDAPRREQPQIPLAPWSAPEALAEYRRATASRCDVLERWQAYKPLTAATIAQFDLGVGYLPFWSERKRRWIRGRHERLILPLIVDSTIVGLTGRAIDPDDDGPKWLTSSFSDLSHLFGLEQVQPASEVIICENRIDACLACQLEPDVATVAVGGAVWHSHWTEQLAARKPRRVLVWLDHDLAGNGSRWHERELLAEWRAKVDARRAANPELAKRPYPTPPTPRGPSIANDLIAAGIRAEVYTWPRNSPLHRDLGAELMAETEQIKAA